MRPYLKKSVLFTSLSILICCNTNAADFKPLLTGEQIKLYAQNNPLVLSNQFAIGMHEVFICPQHLDLNQCATALLPHNKYILDLANQRSLKLRNAPEAGIEPTFDTLDLLEQEYLTGYMHYINDRLTAARKEIDDKCRDAEHQAKKKAACAALFEKKTEY